MQKKQTAVQWLNDKWSNCKEWKWEEIEQWCEQAKEMEKQQMKGMYIEGSFAMMRKFDGKELVTADKYIFETYGSKGSDESVKNFWVDDAKYQELIKPASSQTEISYEEMRKAAINYNKKTPHDWEIEASFIDGARWYREQLKNIKP